MQSDFSASSQPSNESKTSPKPTQTLYWSRIRFVRMVKVFVFRKDEILHIYKILPRYMIDALHHDCFFNLLEKTNNVQWNKKVDKTLLIDNSYPIYVRELNPFPLVGYRLTAERLKSKVRNLRSIFPKAFLNFQMSVQCDNDDGGYDEDVEI